MSLWVKSNNKTIGFVPTMGALHDGHISLIKKAKLKSKKVIVSIFVNPKQFNSNNDFSSYPNTIENDLKKLKANGVNIVYIPKSVTDIYDNETPISLNIDDISCIMEGKFRTGHFDGMIRVVNILICLIKPKYAFFGEKDYQQLLIIKKLASTLDFACEIIGCPTVREASGLAMSSRNLLLSEQKKEDALIIQKAFKYCIDNFKSKDILEIQKSCIEILSTKSKVEYFEIRDEKTLVQSKTNTCRAFAAIKIANVRLIDNFLIT
jgi:pantoate--beta-alanine ligase